MKRRGSAGFVWVVALVSGALAVWAVSVFRQGRALRAEMAMLDARRHTLESDLRDQTARKEEQSKALQAIEATNARTLTMRTDSERLTLGLLQLIDEFSGRGRSGKIAEKPIKRPPPPYNLSDEVCFPEMLRDAEYLRLCTTHYRYKMETQYAPLLNALKLPAELRAKFIALLAEKRLAEIETGSLLKARSVGWAGLTGQSKIDTIVAAELDPEIRSTIGDAAFERFRDFERMQWVRSPMAGLAQRLATVKIPLSEEQENALVQMLYASTKPDARTGRVWVSAFSSEAVENARSLLTPEQWKELRAIQEQEAAQNKVFNRSIESAVKQSQTRNAAKKK